MDKKISELASASSIDGADVSVLVHNHTDYQYTFATLLTYLGNNLPIGAGITFGTTLPQNNTGKNGDVFINTAASSFAQKMGGAWTVVYTLPSGGGSQADGTVLYGLGTPTNSTGNNNDTYINTGTGIFYKKTAGAWSPVFTMLNGPAGAKGDKGDKGDTGTPGKTLLSGTANPSNLTDGSNGDYYINTSTYILFGPKTAGVWGSGVSLVGPDGAKGDKGDSGVPNGGTTGQVLAKASNANGDVHFITPTGGSVSGLHPQEITFGASGGNLQQDADLKFDASTHSLYKAVTATQTAWSGNAYFLGDSITMGAASDARGKKFSRLVCEWLGLTEHNLGVNGMALESDTRTPGVLSGGGALVDNLYLIPNYTAGADAFLCIVIGINDLTIYFDNFNATNFAADYQLVLNNAISKGWTYDRIILGSIPYIDPATYVSSFSGAAVLNQTRVDAFNTVIHTLVNTNGCLFANIYNDEKNTGAGDLMANYLHPTNEGHQVIALSILNGLLSPVQKNGQAMAINGDVELNALKYKNLQPINPDTSFKLGVDNTGKIGIVYGIKGGERVYGDLILKGALFNEKPTFPAGFGNHDYLLPKDARIWATWDNQPDYANYIRLIDDSAVMTICSQYGIRLTDADGNYWMVKAGQIRAQGAGAISSFKGPGDIVVNYGNGLEAVVDGGYGRLTPIDDHGYTTYRNSYQNGKHIFYVSEGVTGGEHIALTLFKNGAIKLAVDDSTPEPSLSVDFSQMPNAMAFPTMTATARDAIALPIAGAHIYNSTTSEVNFYNGTAWQKYSYTAA